MHQKVHTHTHTHAGVHTYTCMCTEVLPLTLPPSLPLPQEDNLKIVLSHGLQCVVKNKVEEAETILTQALYLPDFQRLSLKAFLYICLAVLANKRRKAG